MSDTPLYCPCGNRLGLRRGDAVFVSRHRGRKVAVEQTVPGMIQITCEHCDRTTDVDKLEESAVT